jgi:nicotinamide phosphoribosyltransferase
MVFGMGGGLLQKINRDTQRFAFKSSAQCRNGTWHDVYKMPKDLSKASKRGRLALLKTGDVWETKREEEVIPERNALVTVFENGDIVKEYTFTTVRNNAEL